MASGAQQQQQQDSTKKKLSKNAKKHFKWLKRRRKKNCQPKPQLAARHQPQSDPLERITKAIEYLKSWYESPETWKYRKIAQITLIKYAFNSEIINEDTYELLLHYLAGVQGAARDRLRSMCQQLIESEGTQPEKTELPLVIPESEDSTGVVNRAKRMLEFVLPS